jgi:thiosulfate dehydrogenase (quinone) large subunit
MTLGVAESWVRQSWPVRVLRAFLGVTFAYAGVQKFADPNFLHPGTPDYIGTQLLGFERGSPIHPVLGLFAHVPVLTGIGIALLEIAIGLGTLLGVAGIAFAALGLLVNVTLFLSATWHVHPYFLGSDSAYAVAWAALLAGLIDARRVRKRVPVHGTRRQRAAAAGRPPIARREFLRGAAVGVGTVVLGMGATAWAGSQARARPRLRTATPTRIPSKRGGPAHSGASPPIAAPKGTPIAKLDALAVGAAVGFTDPGSGEPSVLLRPTANSVEAFSRICTHAGCPVQWDPGSKLLVCPCHGAEFDPARNAAPVAGPASTPLRRIPVAVDSATGEILATS